MLRHLKRGVFDALQSSCINQRSAGVLEQAGLQNFLPHHCCSQQLLHSTQASQAPVQVQNVPMPAWTPTAQLKKRKTLPKRMGYLLQVSCRLSCVIPAAVAMVAVSTPTSAAQSLEAEQVAAAEQTRQFPAFRPGDVLELRVVSTAVSELMFIDHCECELSS